MSAKTTTKEFVATGRRKTSTARVRIQEGTGTFTINNRPHNEYCTTDLQRKMVIAPSEHRLKSPVPWMSVLMYLVVVEQGKQVQFVLDYPVLWKKWMVNFVLL
jgi:ribosomal protein S9